MDTLRHALDAIPVPPLFVAGLLSWLWWPTLQGFSEVAHAVAMGILLVLAVYKAWQAYRDHGKSTVSAMQATANAAGAAAKFRFGLFGAAAVALTAIVAIGAYLWTKRDPVPAVAVGAAPVVAAGRRKRTADDAGEEGTEDAPAADPSWPEWYRLAYEDLGVAECPGICNNRTVVQYYADAGFPAVKSDDVAWCAAFVGAMLERAGIPCSKSLMARSYERWGEDASASPRIGDVVTIWRGSKRSAWGHVFFYAGETATHVKGLGGNQADMVSLALFPKSRITSIRRPRPIAKSRIVGAGAAAAASSAVTGGTAAAVIIAETTDLVVKTGDKVAGPVGNSSPTLALYIILGCALLSVTAGVYTIWRRAQDKKQRGH
jgi:uncharacterized protein (TIGR02594 family)